MTEAVKIVPLVADQIMKSAAEKLWKDSDFNFVQFEPEDFYETMVRAAPASDYVAVRRETARYLRTRLDGDRNADLDAHAELSAALEQ